MQAASYMIISSLFFTCMGTIVKALAHLPFYELVLFRSLIILGICAPQIISFKSSMTGKKENRKLLILRGLSGTAGLTLYFWTLQKLDFSTAVTIQYTSPVFTFFIATYLFNEEKSGRSLFWMMIAFLGVATIYRFRISGAELWPVSLGLLAAFCSGYAYNCIAQLKNREPPQVIMIFFPLITIPVVTAPSILEFIMPDLQDTVMIAAMGICTYFAQLFLTRAYQGAPAAKVAIYGNLNVVISLLIGVLIFQETVDFYKITGAALILLSVFAVQVHNQIHTKKQSRLQTDRL